MTPDMISHPPHYTAAIVQMDIEPIDVDEVFGFCRGNALKYVARADFKGKHDEDLGKALWYLRRAKKPRFGFNINKYCPKPQDIFEVWFYLSRSKSPVFQKAFQMFSLAPQGYLSDYWECLEKVLSEDNAEVEDLRPDARYSS